MMLSVKENEDRVTLVNVRTGEMEEFDWEEMKQAIADNMDCEKSPEESWAKIYGEEFPQKEEVAPVQQPAPRKESKVSKAKVEEPKEEKKEEKVQEPIEQENKMQQPEEPKEEMQQDAAAEEPEKETQVEGQTDIYDHPEYLPEGMERPEEKPKETRTKEEKQKCQRTMLDGVIKLQEMIVKKNYSEAKRKCQELMWYLDKEESYEEHNA